MTAPAARVAALARAMGVEVAPDRAGAMVALLDRMALEAQNLSTIDPFEGGIERHLADSLSGLVVGELATAGAIADIGSGGGFPGMPIAIACPDCAVTLVESERRKADWLARAARDLPNVRVVADRTETLARAHPGEWDVVTARAVGELPSVVELAAPLLRVGGTLVVWRGSPSPDEEARGDVVAALVGLAPGRTRPVAPFPGARRHLRVYRKERATPERFPRRPARAARRPLA